MAVEHGRGEKVMLGLAATVVVCAGMKLAAPLLVPFLVAAFVSVVTTPIVLWLCKMRVPRGLAVALAILLDIGAIAAFGAMVGGGLNSFLRSIPTYEKQLAQSTHEIGQWIQGFGIQIDSNSLTDVMDTNLLMEMLVELLSSFAGVVSKLLLVLIIVGFMLFEAAGMRDKMIRIMAGPEALERVERAGREVNKYLVVKTISSVVTGVLVGVWVALFGIDQPVLWGLLAFLLNYVPTLGSVIAAIPAILLALVQHGPGVATVVTGGYLVINITIGQLVEPRVLGRALGLSPLVIILSVIFWGWLLGPMGALLSAPLTMTVKIFLANSEDTKWIAVLLASSRSAEELAEPHDSLRPPPPSADFVAEAAALPQPRAGSASRRSQPPLADVPGDGDSGLATAGESSAGE